MAEERIPATVRTDSQPNQIEGIPAHTTVIVDRRHSGGSTMFIVLFLLIAVAIGGYLFIQMKGAEVAKNDAIEQAAENVGKAADKIGAAAEKAGNAAENAVGQMENR